MASLSYNCFYTYPNFRFKQAELEFLKDYACVMKPVPQALNILQGENNNSNAYMGFLAPTISILKKKLHQKKSSTPGLEPLADALLSGIEKRFKSMLADEKIIAAAILHPKFKDQWTEDNDLLQKGSVIKTNCFAGLNKLA